MEAADIVKQCRAQAGLSIRALADAAGVAASTVHRIEQGQIDPSTETLALIARAAGFRLEIDLALDGAASVSGLGRCIAADLATAPDDATMPVRRAAELVARFDRADAATRRRMLAARPAPTGDVRWDSFLGAVAEWLAVGAQLEPPAWVHEPMRYLDRSWWVTRSKALQAWEFAGSPMAFKQHGVYLHRDSLVNV